MPSKFFLHQILIYLLVVCSELMITFIQGVCVCVCVCVCMCVCVCIHICVCCVCVCVFVCEL